MNGQFSQGIIYSLHSTLDKLQAVARRKNLPKFGMSKEDRPGPNPQTTIVAEDVYMQFIAGKDEADKMDTEGEKSALELLKEKASKGVVKCRICKEDHWTTNCPYKVCSYVHLVQCYPFTEISPHQIADHINQLKDKNVHPKFTNISTYKPKYYSIIIKKHCFGRVGAGPSRNS